MVNAILGLGYGFEDAMVSPQDLESPRLRCFFIFKDEDPTEPDYVRDLWWYLPTLQNLLYGLDKEYSRAISRLAIPALLTEINIRRQPREAKRLFWSMAVDPDLFLALTEVAEGCDGEQLGEHFERILRLSANKNGGSGS